MRLLARLSRGPELLYAFGLRLLRAGLGLRLSLPTEDRRVLERLVIPFFSERAEFGRVLFVGCDWYTEDYARLFASKEYWTLDKDPRRRRHGAARHVTDALVNLGAHFAQGYFDVVLCNGVLGWGLDDRKEAEASLEACRRCLREGGVLVLGWNDIPEKRPLPPSESESLARMRPWVFPPLQGASHPTRGPSRHTFNFYVKPASGASA